MTQLLFLGSGSAFTVGADNFQSNLLLTSARGNRLLIDCGSDIRFSLHSQGYSYLDITDIYISHLHADHIGGLEYIGFSTKFDPRCPKPNLYLSKELESELWERSLAGGMRSVQGDLVSLDFFFNVCPVEATRSFEWEDIQFNLVKVVHVDNGYFVVPSYGLGFEVNRMQVFLTTDTQLHRCLEDYARADLIFQDCEISFSPSGVHSHYQELVQLPLEIKSKMWLYGYQPGELPHATQDGFKGFVKRGQLFDFDRLPLQSSLRA